MVEESQRQRLLAAATVAVCEKGYAGMTVRDMTAGAGVSRRTFYEYYADKQGVLLAAYDAGFERLLEQLRRACAAQRDWPAKLIAAIVAALRFASVEPEAARMITVETTASGAAGADRVLASRRQLAELLAPGREHSPLAARLPALVEPALVDAIWTAIGDWLVGGGAEPVEALESKLIELALLPYEDRNVPQLTPG